ADARPGTTTGDVDGRNDGNAPRTRDATAHPDPAALSEQHLQRRLRVDLVVLERAIEEGTTRVADHFTTEVIEDGRNEIAGNCAVGDLPLLAREPRRTTRG